MGNPPDSSFYGPAKPDGSWHRDSVPGWEAVARRWDYLSDLDDQQLVRLQLDRARIACEGIPVDEDVELLAGGSGQGPGVSERKGLAPDIEELTQGELSLARRLYVDDPIGLVCMEPIEALGLLADPDVRGQGHLVPVLEQGEVGMEVRLDHLALALDAVDRGTSRARG